jgi:hypothetical protein
VTVPSWINSVPRNFGQKAAGSLKADEWRTMATIYLPLALTSLWDGHQPTGPSTNAQILNHAMHLFQAISIAMRYTITPKLATAYRMHMKAWTEDLLPLFPELKLQKRTRTNVHIALHIYDFLLDFGPVISWWAFPFERMIGIIQKITTNEHIGGTSIYLTLTSF